MNTLGQHIRKLRKEKGLSQQALAHACGWESQSRIGNYEKGTRQPSLQDIRKIADTLGVSFVDLVAFTDDNAQPLVVKLKDSAPRLTGKAKEGRVPVVGTAQLGNEGYFDALDFPPGHGDGYLNIHSDDPDAYGLKVTGDSMLPRIKNGEFVLIEPNKSYVSGDEVMVRTAAGRTMIKEYIYLRDGMYRFDSVNAEHPPIHIAKNEILEIHLVGGILKSSRFLHTATEI
ncbi:putative phage repressor [Pseudomonas syringae pv. helianthi]|uniref:Putative phage repressor n=1 Tax=Pseudomonas syringae pv. helianthi TaxID=251654 RepID=A0A0P9T3D7_9PSED|nr:S24 family peptidase [Pseudomonas syringae group genomosp. 7]KPX50192.1 putative phage repressor [Pseudomonas syringae pv. helianthi]UNB62073.1 helix-turn-helix domain-containing protein [Pseudomonas syringae pv. helianthi]